MMPTLRASLVAIEGMAEADLVIAWERGADWLFAREMDGTAGDFASNRLDPEYAFNLARWEAMNQRRMDLALAGEAQPDNQPHVNAQIDWGN